MACETRRRRGQSLSVRQKEVKDVISKIAGRILQEKTKIVIDKFTGAVAFTGIDDIRDDVTDACVFRALMISGPMTVKLAIQKAEALAGRTVSKEALAQGVHSHDGGQSWGSH
jgi:hypothetical protein